MELLKVENLCKVYGNGENEVRATDGISFTVPKGQMAAIVGASGSGNSTLLHMIGAEEKYERSKNNSMHGSYEWNDNLMLIDGIRRRNAHHQKDTDRSDHNPHGAVFHIRFYKTAI